jgi:hypothetical protein
MTRVQAYVRVHEDGAAEVIAAEPGGLVAETSRALAARAVASAEVSPGAYHLLLDDEQAEAVQLERLAGAAEHLVVACVRREAEESVVVEAVAVSAGASPTEPLSPERVDDVVAEGVAAAAAALAPGERRWVDLVVAPE